MKEIFETYDNMLEGVGMQWRGNFKQGDWAAVQALEAKHLKQGTKEG